MNNQNKTHNQKLRRNNRVFAALMIVAQLAISLLYALTYTSEAHFFNVTAVLNAILLALLVNAGFGLVTANLKRLVWSGLGFSLFIFAFSVQVYPLVNNFWIRVGIGHSSFPFGFSDAKYSLYLNNSSLSSDKLYGNYIINAMKCSLSLIVAFSSILGRAGPLECFFVTTVGVFGFQLNRLIVTNITIDAFGSFFIFTYGGFMGVSLGVILRFCKQKIDKGSSTAKNSLNEASLFSCSLSLFGSLIVLTFFSILAYEVDVTNPFNTFYLNTGSISVIIGSASSIVASFCLSSLINYKIIIRDLVHAPIAGGIVTGSAAFFITAPLYAILAGFTAGVSQVLLQNFIERRWLKSKSIISTISWSLFGVQGLIGGAFASGYRLMLNQSNPFLFQAGTISYSPESEILGAIISAGIGIGFGVIAGIIILFVSCHKSRHHFNDKSYWTLDDGIIYREPKTPTKIAKRIQPLPLVIQLKPQSNHDDPKQEKQKQSSEFHEKNVRIEYSQVIPFDVSSPNFEMSFSEPSQRNKSHTFL